MKAPWFRVLLDPLGPLSPLNVRHPLNPLRSQLVGRAPPPVLLDEDHDSVIARCYGDAVTLDRVPFPNTERWWNSVDVTLRGARFSIITSVQLFGLPGSEGRAHAVVAVRNLDTGLDFQVSAAGTLDAGRSCRFSAPGFHLRRTADSGEKNRGHYLVNVVEGDFELDMALTQGRVAYFNDPNTGPEQRGWYDNNPNGNIPYWSSHRSRFGAVEHIQLRLPGGFQAQLDGPEGHARFDHQSVHASPKDVGGLSPGVVEEALITRVQWFSYTARFRVTREDAHTPASPLNLSAHELRNGYTGRILKRVAALSDDDGNVSLLRGDMLDFRSSRAKLPGRVGAPRNTTFDFAAFGPVSGEVEFACLDDAPAFTVSYPVTRNVHCEATVAVGALSGKILWNDQKRIVTGTGTLEALDTTSSLVFDR
jgi:hypothetical protein